jgi:uncharacterized membrane protein YtjA (UPF0391 family)
MRPYIPPCIEARKRREAAFQARTGTSWQKTARDRRSITREEVRPMLTWSIILLVIAVIAGIFGFGGIAGAAAGMAKILFVIFLVLFVISLVFGRRKTI